MNLVDILLIALVLLSLIRGLRLGAAVQVLSFGGFWAGLVLGALIAPWAAGLVSSNFAKAIVSLVVVFGAASIVGAVGRHLGIGVWRAIHRVHLGPADAGVGAVVAAAATLLAAWIVASMLLSSPFPKVVRQLQGSAILRGLDGVLPPAPSVFGRIQRLLDTHGFPQVFAQLSPKPVGPVPLPSDPTLRQVVAVAGRSTVKIVSQGCGELLEGSGFVVAPGVVVTNAHVIAGTQLTKVFDDNGTHPATAVYFDPGFDLAVLRTGGAPLAGPPLRLDPTDVSRGAQGGVLGYPGGGDFTAVKAAVAQLFQAVGRNIYGTGLTTRSVYELDATVLPGNSGGPMVATNGEVIGVVFSRSASDPTIGYALASPQVLAKVTTAERSSAPVGTGACAD
ncbi:MAG TPA: MarP family serine protease [Acidimicrobiales bacterium]|nr:MarP family serine protease [Acidimicrobiales bacterium]